MRQLGDWKDGFAAVNNFLRNSVQAKKTKIVILQLESADEALARKWDRD
jgi:hypothetical protein